MTLKEELAKMKEQMKEEFVIKMGQKIDEGVRPKHDIKRVLKLRKETPSGR